jgi:hypothetical protein
LTVGRQGTDDDREWLYDENQDAIRLLCEWPRTVVDFSVAWEDILDDDILSKGKDEHVDDCILRVECYWSKHVKFGPYIPYILYRDDNIDDWERALFL